MFCLVYLVYIANGRTIGCGDTVPASLLPFSILENHNLYFDQFVLYYNLNVEYIYFFNEINGHFLSSYPIVTPILITPIYAILFLFLKLFVHFRFFLRTTSGGISSYGTPFFRLKIFPFL